MSTTASPAKPTALPAAIPALRERFQRDPKVDLIGGLGLFEGLSRRRLREAASVFDIVDLEQGTELTAQGHLGHEFFVVVEGVASVERDGTVIGAVGPGEIVGELAVLDTPVRTATVVARTPMRVLVAERRQLAPLLGRTPRLAQRVAEIRQARMAALEAA